MSRSVYIRPLLEFDAERLCEAVIESKAELAPWLPWCHPGYSIDDTRAWLNHQVQAFIHRDEYAFGIFDDADGLLGGCGLNKVSHENQMANLGYWVRSSAVRQGVASEATRLLADWAFRNTDLLRLEILVSVENHASQRAAEKAGAKREGILRSRIILQGKPHNCVMYSIVRSDVGFSSERSETRLGSGVNKVHENR